MPSIDIIDISEFRVRVPANLYPYQGSHVLEVRCSDAPGLDSSEWSTIPKAGDSHVSWKSGLPRGRFFCGGFEERNLLNIPGPFYGAQTDTCATGPVEAPHNVMLDGGGQEFVFRQPTTTTEIQQVIGAAICDPFQGYGADGDEHWTLQRIRDWWTENELRIGLMGRLAETNRSTDQRTSFLAVKARTYLCQYGFFVDNGRLPREADHLPDM